MIIVYDGLIRELRIVNIYNIPTSNERYTLDSYREGRVLPNKVESKGSSKNKIVQKLAKVLSYHIYYDPYFTWTLLQGQ